MAWVGKCKNCGECCKVAMQWLSFSNEEEKERALSWAKARGYDIIQITDNIIQANYKSVCPNLVDNKCKIQDTKPKWCSEFPFNFSKEYGEQLGIEVKYIVPKNCGFKWIEENDEKEKEK